MSIQCFEERCEVLIWDLFLQCVCVFSVFIILFKGVGEIIEGRCEFFFGDLESKFQESWYYIRFVDYCIFRSWLVFGMWQIFKNSYWMKREGV